MKIHHVALSVFAKTFSFVNYNIYLTVQNKIQKSLHLLEKRRRQFIEKFYNSSLDQVTRENSRKIVFLFLHSLLLENITLKNILIHLGIFLSTVPMRILEGLSSTKNLVVVPRSKQQITCMTILCTCSTMKRWHELEATEFASLHTQLFSYTGKDCIEHFDLRSY